MRVAFVVHGLPSYRVVGPSIDRALELGWEVECWHDYSQPKDGPKGYRFPHVSACPRFQQGQPRVRPYAGAAELAAWLERGEATAVVSTGTPWSDAGRALPANRLVWTCLQAGAIDTFLNHAIESLDSCDLLALHSPWWTEWAAAHYAGGSDGRTATPLRARLAARSTFVGSPDADAALMVDPAEVRRRWGIPPDRPVVLLLPFPQGVGRNTFWPRKVFGEPSRIRRVVNVAVYRRLKYWQEAWAGPDDHAIVAAVRKFCDRNGAFLLVKSRLKTPIPEYTRAVADKCLYDESYYPSTILEALSIARVCVNYYSASVLEAAAVGVPNLCITFPAEQYLGDDAGVLAYFGRFFTREEGGVFQFGGVSTTMSIEEALVRLPALGLDDVRVDADARREYIRKFLGWNDGRSAVRLVNAIASQAGRVAVPPPRARSSQWTQSAVEHE